MRRKDWERELKELTGGHPLISKRTLRKLGLGDTKINALVDGLDRYPAGYAVPDVAERIMGSRI